MSTTEAYITKRNLSVLSTLVILFNLSGITISEQLGGIQIINLNFERSSVIGYFIWVMLFWFAFRYWQFFKFKFKQKLYEEVAAEDHNASWWIRYLTKKTGKPAAKIDNGVCPVDLAIVDDKVALYYGRYKRMQGSVEMTMLFTRSKEYLIVAEGFSGFIAVFITIVHRAVVSPIICSHFVPYLLFLAAIILHIFD